MLLFWNPFDIHCNVQKSSESRVKNQGIPERKHCTCCKSHLWIHSREFLHAILFFNSLYIAPKGVKVLNILKHIASSKELTYSRYIPQNYIIKTLNEKRGCIVPCRIHCNFPPFFFVVSMSPSTWPRILSIMFSDISLEDLSLLFLIMCTKMSLTILLF